MPVLSEAQRRRDDGSATVLQVRHGIEKLQRAVGSFIEHMPRSVDAASALITWVSPRDFSLVLLELCLAEHGWRTRVAGPGSPDAIADEIAQVRPDALIVALGSRPDAPEFEWFSRELSRRTSEIRVPVALFGVGARPDPRTGLTRLHAFCEARAWIEQIARTRGR